MRQGLDKSEQSRALVIKQNKVDFRIPEYRFPTIRICDFSVQEYSMLLLFINGCFYRCVKMNILLFDFTDDSIRKTLKINHVHLLYPDIYNI